MKLRTILIMAFFINLFVQPSMANIDIQYFNPNKYNSYPDNQIYMFDETVRFKAGGYFTNTGDQPETSASASHFQSLNWYFSDKPTFLNNKQITLLESDESKGSFYLAPYSVQNFQCSFNQIQGKNYIESEAIMRMLAKYCQSWTTVLTEQETRNELSSLEKKLTLLFHKKVGEEVAASLNNSNQSAELRKLIRSLIREELEAGNY